MTKTLKEQLVEAFVPTESDPSKHSLELSASKYEQLAVDHTGLSKEDIKKLEDFNHQLLNTGAEYMVDCIQAKDTEKSEDGVENKTVNTIVYDNRHIRTKQSMVATVTLQDKNVTSYGVELLTVARKDSTFSEKLSKRVKDLLEPSVTEAETE